jgi:hypothetical protein
VPTINRVSESPPDTEPVTLTSLVEAARKNRPELVAQLQLAEARYAQGLGSQIELADARTAVTTAEDTWSPPSSSWPPRGRSSTARTARSR